MNDVSGRYSLGLNGDGGRNDLFAPYLARSNDRWSIPLSSGTIALTEGGLVTARQRRLQLRRFYGNPEHVTGGNFDAPLYRHAEISKWAFQLKLIRILASDAGLTDHCDRRAVSGQASAYEATYTASPENRMSQGSNHSLFLLGGRGGHAL